MQASALTSFLHSRACAIVMTVLAVGIGALFFFSGLTEPLEGNRGLALPSANEWCPDPTVDFVAAMAGNILTVVLMMTINKVYNLLRSMTYLYASLFIVMQLATPDFFTQLYTGTMLPPVICCALLLMMNCYRSPDAPRPVYLIFLLLSMFFATQYCYAVYTVVFLLGCAQMRCLNWRTLVASFLGIITPWWIMFGFGLITLSDLHLPDVTDFLVSFEPRYAALLLITVGLTALQYCIFLVLNMMKAIAYNARARANNGLITVTALLTIAAMVIDYRNISAYIPLLNVCAAFQAAHFFSTHRADKSWIAITMIILVYVTIFACQILL